MSVPHPTGIETCLIQDLSSAVSSDLSLLAIAPHLPESPAETSARLHHFFVAAYLFIPVLLRQEIISAFEDGEHVRSLPFRALLFSVLSMSVASIIAEEDSPEKAVTPEVKASTHRILRSYIDATKRCNSLLEAQEDTETLAGVVVPIHLFMTFEWIKEHQSSWDALQLAITRAQKLKMVRWVPDMWKSAPTEGFLFFSTRLKVYYLL